MMHRESCILDIVTLFVSDVSLSTVQQHVHGAGITKFAYLESLIGKGTHQKTPELDALVTSGMTYFRQAVDLYGGIEKSEVIRFFFLPR